MSDTNVLWGVLGITAFCLFGLGMLMTPAAMGRIPAQWQPVATWALQLFLALFWGASAYAGFIRTHRWPENLTIVLVALWMISVAGLTWRLTSALLDRDSRQ